jgi:hypothetical protein
MALPHPWVGRGFRVLDHMDRGHGLGFLSGPQPIPSTEDRPLPLATDDDHLSGSPDGSTRAVPARRARAAARAAVVPPVALRNRRRDDTSACRFGCGTQVSRSETATSRTGSAPRDPRPLVDVRYGPASSGSRGTAYRPMRGFSVGFLHQFPDRQRAAGPWPVEGRDGEGRRGSPWQLAS